MSDVAIGVDVGGTKALALMVARDGRIIGEIKSQTPHDEGFGAGEATAKVIAEQVFELCERQSLDATQVPVGIGLPGMMRRDGHLAFAPNLQTASGADLGSLLSSVLGNSSIFCENDANCAALAEHEWGAGRGIRDFVMVTLGTGIGGGVVADGQLVRGRSGFAGEIGHMVVEAHGAPCLCGGRGCWERYASGGGLQRLTREAALNGRLSTLVASRDGDPHAVRAEDVSAAAADGLEEAISLMREVGWWLALGLSNLVAILDCGHFVIGG
jgi:glucokinase